MPANFNVHGELIDITFTWTDIPSALAQEIVFGSALYRWRLGEGPMIVVGNETVQKPWSDLSAQEKLNLAYRSAKKLITEEAKASLVNTDVVAARAAAIAHAEANYELPE